MIMTSHYNDKDLIDSADAAASLPPPLTADSYDSDSKKRSAEEADFPLDASEEHKKIQARREANRMHAFKSRQRSKLLLTDLQATVQQLSREKSELERQNAVLRAQVEVLQQQNFTLMQNQQQMLLQQQQQKQQQPPNAPQQPAAPTAVTATNFPYTAATATNPFLAAAAAFSSGAASPFMNPSLATMMAGMMGAASVNPVMLQNMQAFGAMPSGNSLAAAAAAIMASTNNNQTSTSSAGLPPAASEATNSSMNPLGFVSSSSLPLPQSSTPDRSHLSQLAAQAEEAAGSQQQHSQSRNHA